MVTSCVFLIANFVLDTCTRGSVTVDLVITIILEYNTIIEIIISHMFDLDVIVVTFWRNNKTCLY